MNNPRAGVANSVTGLFRVLRRFDLVSYGAVIRLVFLARDQGLESRHWNQGFVNRHLPSLTSGDQ